ncbi:hypothetical protein DDB_G0273257 [Dictyostelium discoideum AX4]|uniref:Communication mutant protein F n=1 Tax=Dictyostelium discoideum TaxID=44689 RepID=COMF_DICDI|nr:hypothetical protein DDB_G0273669 [Dictyostelium discoideum AX4]XP_644799.1 hypothetical protein DDB_G0273257 [Dictyostelium discoideum AX4]Q557B8.1 RecName: Full=Communication mutant protein F; Flags: Precursor [Dictyostelium discoideum]EAL70525.1 hypothetical protein DDB_G0273669 [Dictyostelium discoideum AX4]EAL70846.1 hypothetical protein DDB_G0273257 [Dictyostelium discoideum AX4]|eukprot:XP_644451.1 hypothetical protein DDB_G0273669 [Dictyostelium discoideum AX4]
MKIYKKNHFLKILIIFIYLSCNILKVNADGTFSTIQPSTDIKFDKSNLEFVAEWDVSANSISNVVGSTDSSEFSLNYGVWGPTYNYLIAKNKSPSIKANVDYTFSFDFKLGKALGEYNNYQSMVLSFYIPEDIAYFPWEIRTPLYTTNEFSGNFASTSYQSKILTFRSTVDIGNSIMVLRINRATETGPTASSVYFRNMKITIPSKPITTPTDLLTKDSELIVIPKPPISLDLQDLTKCPYLTASDLYNWHDPTIWPNGVVPSPNQNITIPAGKRVLISASSISQTQIYSRIVVPVNSELIFNDQNFTMNIRDIYVQGKFIMGTSLCRYNSFINIIFHGEKTLQDTIAQFYGSKGIAVASGGFISVQGKQYHNTWSKLASNVWSGDRVIWIQDNVNWEVGQQVLITTSVYKDELDNQNEILTIKAIEGKKIEFTEPIKWFKYGSQEYQSEVALLSRRIVFSSDESSSVSTSFGGHILSSGEMQFAGVQLKRMGQKNVKARYPLHYHLGGTLNNSFISDCSVTNSYYRCYTIHGTNNVTLTRNVAYDAFGHCYYLEDGVEVDNRISFNLGAYVHTIGKPAAGASQIGETFYQSSELTQPADSAASCFYITNSWNSFIGNAASGGWAGFAFPNLPKPIGNHRTLNIIPMQYPIKEWQGNTAHSSGYYFEDGASIYVGGNLTFNEANGMLIYNSGRLGRTTYVNGVKNENNVVFDRLNNTKIFLSNLGVGYWGENIEIVGYESHDNTRPVSLFGNVWLHNALVNGQSGNILTKNSETTRQGFRFYDFYVQTIISNTIFRNFIHSTAATKRDEDNVVITATTFSDVFKPQFISATKNITFQNVPQSQIIGHEDVANSGSSRLFNFLDGDGSVTSSFTGKPGIPQIVGSHVSWWKFDDSCLFSTEWNVWVCNKGTKGLANIEFWVPGFMERELEQDPDSYIGSISLFGSGINDERKTLLTRNPGITGVSNMGWYAYFTIGTPNYLRIWTAQIAFGEYIFLAIPYPTGTTFTITSEYDYSNQYTYTITKTTSALAVKQGNGKQYYFDGTHLFLKLVNFMNTGGSWESFDRVGIKIPDVYWTYIYNIRATNTAKPSVNGYFLNLPDVRPSSTL